MLHIPQVPPHPSLPHCLPVQSGRQHTEFMHFSPGLHAQSAAQVLQDSLAVGSHVASPHDCMDTHLLASQMNRAAHPVPHVPPHPSSPHSLPAQFGAQHADATHFPPPQVQSPGHVSHDSPASHIPLPQ
jgi:hypothetical protein